MGQTCIQIAMCLALVAGVATVDAGAATTLQEVRGSVKLGAGPDSPELARRAYVGSDGDVNGLTGYVFALDPSSIGGRFDLKVISGLTPPDRVYISFLEDLSGSHACDIDGPGDARGTTCGSYAIVWMQTGTEMSFLYTAEPGPCGQPRLTSPVSWTGGLDPRGDPATATQLNAAHTGYAVTSLAPPLRRNWALDFNGTVGEPVVAEGKAFIPVGSKGGACASRLFVLNLRDATQPWGPVTVPGSAPFKLAYDDGKLFVLTMEGVLQAYRASDGSPLWSIALPGSGNGSGLTARDGVLYSVWNYQLRALSEATGDTLWLASYGGGGSDPAVTSDGVFLASGQGRAYRYDLATGERIWVRPSNGSSTSDMPVVHAGAMYDRNTVSPGSQQLVLDVGDGHVITTFTATKPPAFDGATGFFLWGSTLRAQNLTTLATRWNFAGDGQLANGPLVGNGTVYVASASTLYALDEGTGQPVWQEQLDTTTGTYNLPAMALGNGFLVVPAGERLLVFR